MKIAIDTIPLLSPLTGVGNYTYQISKMLKTIDHVNSYEYYYGYYSKRLFTYDDRATSAFFRVKEVIKKVPVAGPVARQMKSVIAAITGKEFDVYFEPNFIPLDIKAGKIVVTVPDFSFKVHPEWHPKDRIEYFEGNFWQKIGTADSIIFISDYIRDCAVNEYGFPQRNLKTIYLGFDKDIFRSYENEELQLIRKKYRLPENFIFSVGSIEPRKNLKNLIHAYIGLDKTVRREFKIVLAGFKGWNNKEIMELLEKVKDDVIYLGYVPDSDLGKLYNVATLFVYPSLYEGFGLPPLEAMACGCPAVVSNVTSLPEVCGDAACYVDPFDVESITDGIHRVVTDETLRRSLIAKGFERAKLFSWERSARAHLKVFEEG